MAVVGVRASPGDNALKGIVVPCQTSDVLAMLALALAVPARVLASPLSPGHLDPLTELTKDEHSALPGMVRGEGIPSGVAVPVPMLKQLPTGEISDGSSSIGRCAL